MASLGVKLGLRLLVCDIVELEQPSDVIVKKNSCKSINPHGFIIPGLLS